MQWSVRAALLCALLLAPSAAHAHGRFPAAMQVAVDPQNTGRLLVRMTYGLMLSQDGGETWSFLCPGALGYQEAEDPQVALAHGAVVVGTSQGLMVAPDGACGWAKARGGNFVDVHAFAEAGTLRALRSKGVATSTFDVGLVESTDAGASWTEIGTAPPPDFLAVGAFAAPSDPKTIYLSGRDGDQTLGLQAVLMRSQDGGVSWTRVVLPVPPGNTVASLGGVDPYEPARLYVVAETRDPESGVVWRAELLASSDGGDSWSSVYNYDGKVFGFALSPDGARLALGGDALGLVVAATSDFAFTQTSAVYVRCLTWTPRGLYACVDEFTDGFSMGVSSDEGKTMTPLLHFTSPCGPPECPASSPVVTEGCANQWSLEQAQFGVDPCGQGGAGGASSSGDPAPPAEGGCGYRTTHATPSPWWFLVALLGLRRRDRFLRPPILLAACLCITGCHEHDETSNSELADVIYAGGANHDALELLVATAATPDPRAAVLMSPPDSDAIAASAVPEFGWAIDGIDAGARRLPQRVHHRAELHARRGDLAEDGRRSRPHPLRHHHRHVREQLAGCRRRALSGQPHELHDRTLMRSPSTVVMADR